MPPQQTYGGRGFNLVAFKVGRLHLEKTRFSEKYQMEAQRLRRDKVVTGAYSNWGMQ
jgi:hypothetical protein